MMDFPEAILTEQNSEECSADIELGTINMVIFKDVSRLGREHIDTNYYLGKYFPENGFE